MSLSTGGAITGLSLAPAAAADLASPTGMPVSLLALEQSVSGQTGHDAMLRSAIVNVANYYLQLARTRTPAQMEAIIWQHASLDGADHGPSCAAFASLTLELGARVVGQHSWVNGGTSYPWPLQSWADARVDPNPASLGIVSILQDAQAHRRWHPLGDGYQPQPGDWVLFDGHVEVVTQDANGLLHAIGGDSSPNFSVNAHEYAAPLAAQGVVGFVDNGAVSGSPVATLGSEGRVSASHAAARAGHQPGGPTSAPRGGQLVAIPGADAAGAAGQAPAPVPAAGAAYVAIPGVPAPAPAHVAAAPAPFRQPATPGPGDQDKAQWQSGPSQGEDGPTAGVQPAQGRAAPSHGAEPRTSAPGVQDPYAAIPGLPHQPHAIFTGVVSSPGHHHHHHQSAPVPAPVSDTGTQRAFINAVAPGAMATQHKYGVPAAVTIAQAILESGWGQSGLATRDHNLFGIKGSGPAGSDPQPSVEYLNGQWVTLPASFRVYHNVGESISDHGALLATSGYYQKAMSVRADPNAFANALTGVYATDPEYGAKLINLMQRYGLYRYGDSAPATGQTQASPGGSPSSTGAAANATPPTPTSGSAPPPATGPQAPAPAAPGGATPPAPNPNQSAPGSPTPRASRARATVSPPGSPRAAPPSLGSAAIPGLPGPTPGPLVDGQNPGGPVHAPRGNGGRSAARATVAAGQAATQTVSAARAPASLGAGPGKTAADGPPAGARTYRPSLPISVKNAFTAMAKRPLAQSEPLYRDVADTVGIRWELLAACDWMQCEARPRYSPVHGERLGTENLDGSLYHTKSAALEQCALDLAELAHAVYGIDLTPRAGLSVPQLASVFAAFRWGGLLKLYHTSAMEFPYSVAGLTSDLLRMRWPNIDHPNTPDKPGGRFRMPFGAVPTVLSLGYRASP